MNNNILEILNLEASINNKTILKNFNLTINKNEIHVIMGPNGCGKSTLSKIITGHPNYKINSGEIFFGGKNLFQFSPEDRSRLGIFLAFQYPLEISGVTNYDFLRLAYNEKQKFSGQSELNPLEFMELVQKRLNQLKIPNEFLNRDLNQGFSGGEKKKNEILQMLLLQPKLVILDELDSGLDIDALKLICESIIKNLEINSSLIIITHYPRILNYFQPNFVHIMGNGRILKTGNLELIKMIEDKGYQSIE
jgi:Fe-S cluster assembly ATP-binding protein